MKKALFILGGVAMFAFASCDNKSDCDCTVKYGEVEAIVPVTEFDGDCDEIKSVDMPDAYKDIDKDPEYSYKCVEQ